MMKKFLGLTAVCALVWCAANTATAATATYTIESTNTVSASGAPSGSSATFSQTYGTKYQMTGGNSMTLTLSGYGGYKITGLTLSMKSNTSKGAGNMSMTSGGSTLASIATANFNASSWHGSWSTSYVNVSPSVTATTIGSGNTVVITISATANSLYCQSFTITYEAAGPASGDIWICPETTGNLGSYAVGTVLGDKWLNCQIGQKSWNMSQVGIGLAGTENTWQSWYTLSWYADGDESNKKVHANLNGYQFTSVGQYNIIYQANNGGATTSKSGDGWGNPGAYPPADIGATYFTVTAVPNPTACSATVSGTSMNLSWTRNGSYNVMVVRYPGNVTPQAPTDGTTYSAGATAGNGVVVYAAGSGASATDSGVSTCTSYKYVFYSENYSYYSSGVTVTADSGCPPTFATASKALTVTVGSPATFTQTATGNPSTMTYSIASGTGASVSSSGAFSYTPSAAGTYNFTIQAANGITPNATYTITVTAKPAAPTVAVNGTTASTISGTISGLTSGATVMLRMYDSASAANSDSDGTSGTDVSANVTVSGTSGTWSVANLDGCTAKSFKAWQTVNSVKSDGSAAATGTTVTPGAPSVTASATPTSVTLSWAAVAGATHYIVNVCPASPSSSAKAVARADDVYELVTTQAGLTDGEYVIVGAVSNFAMKAEASTSSTKYLLHVAVTPVNGTITNPDSTLIWKVYTDSTLGGMVFSNAANGVCAMYGGSGNSAATEASATTKSAWTISSFASSAFTIENVGTPGRYLRYNGSSPRFACYTSGQQALRFFKKVSSGPTCLANNVTVNGTSWSANSGVVQGTTYEWSVVAVGGTAQCTSSAAEGEVTAGGADQAPTFAESSVSLTTTTGEEVTHTQTAVGYPTAMTYSITAGSGATVGASTGEFSFTPSAAGTYSFTIQAANGVAPNATYTIDVTVKPVKPTVTVTTEGAGSLSGTVTGTESGATVNLRRYESQAAADADTTGTSGTAVTVTSGAFTDTGLAGCTTYYYKVWQTKNSQTSVGSDVDSGTAGLAGPTVTVSAQTESSFTMQWASVLGASSYLVQVATDNQFTPGTGSTVLAEDFSGFGTAGAGDGTSDISGSLDDNTSTSGWWGSKIYTGGGRAKLGSGSANGYICTPQMNLPNGGTAKVTVQKYGSDTGTVNVDVTTDSSLSNPTWTTLTTITPSSTATEYTVTLPAGATVTLSVETSAKRAYVCGVVVTGGSSSGGSLIYSQAGTSPTTVTGLEPGTYYYRVQSVGGGSCETWSSVGNVTLSALEPELVVKESGAAVAYDATKAWGNCAVTGGAATKTFTVENPGTAALTLSGLTVTSGKGFTVSGPASGTVAAGGSTTFTVTFTPTVALIGQGTQTATVEFTHNDAGKTSPYRFTVTGAATGGILTISPATHDFEASTLNETKSTTFTLSNTGNASLTVGSVTVSGTGYTLASAWSSTTIAAGGTATVTVNFRPTAVTTYTGTLTATSANAASGSPATASLTGSGINETLGNIWINPLTYGQPIATMTKGSTMGEYYLNFEIGQTNWDSSQVGIGYGNDFANWSWGAAMWYEDGEGNNRRVRRNLSGYQFTRTGHYNVIYQARANSGDAYTSRSGNGWHNYTTWPPTDFGATYIDVADVPDPTGCTATPSGAYINLSWTPGTDARGTYQTMIVRYPASAAVTAPTDGTAYTSGAHIGAGTVEYVAWTGNQLADAVELCGEYKYVFYGENYSYYSPGVVVSATATCLTAPTVAVTTSGAGALTGDGLGETYVVVRNETGTFSGTPTGSVPSEGASFCGGTVVYAGTSAGFTDGTAAGCGTYYYKAWETLGGAWGPGSAVASATMATPGAPELSASSGWTVTASSFTATWNAVPGAVKYRLDVWTGGGTSTVSDTLTRSTTEVTGTSYTAWSGKTLSSTATYAGRSAGGNDSIQLNATSPNGLWTTASGGLAQKVTVVWESHTSSGRTVSVYGKNTAYASGDVNNSSTRGTLLGTIVMGTSTELTITGDYAYIGLAANGALYMTSVTIDWKTGGGTEYVPGYADKDVGGVTSYTVTGLDEETTYHVKVRAEGASGSCTSADSNPESVTTPQDTSLTDVAIANYDAAGSSEGANVAGGNVQAGQTALLQGAKLTVGSGGTTLTKVTFDTAGTAVAADLTALRVRVGSSATWTGSETLLGSATTGLGAGTHEVNGSQALAAGTWYVWIEAATAAGATGGHTVSVPALGTANYTLDHARRTGGTTAAGAQTICKAPTATADGVAALAVTWGALSQGTATLSDGGAYPAATWTITGSSPTPASAASLSGAEFRWTPGGDEIGSTVTFTVRAENAVGTSDCTIAVTVGMVDLTSLTAATATGQGDRVDLSWVLAVNTHGALIRWSDVSLEAIPGPGTAWGSEAEFASGTTSGQATGLTACKTYYFKGWEKNGGTYSAQPKTATATVDAPAAPTGLAATGVTSGGFTATWEAVAGAVDYVLNVWHFAGGSSASLTETFSGMTATGSGSSSYGVKTLSDCDLGTWTATECRTDVGVVVRAGGTLTSPALTIAFTSVSFDYDWPYSESTTCDIDLYVNGTKAGSYTVTGGTSGTATYTGLSGAVGDTIEFRNTAGSDKRMKISEIRISGTAGVRTDDVVDRVVSGTSSSVTGLNPDTEYHWSVSARGDGCTGSETGTTTETPETVGAPQNVSATDGAYYDKVRVTWDAVTGATSYKVYRGETAGAAELVGATSGTQLDDDGTALGLEVGTTYRYWVTSVDGSAHESRKRDWASDEGFAGIVLRETSFEGWSDGWLVTADAGGESRPDHKRGFESRVSGVTGDYALQLAAGEAAVMDPVSLGSGSTGATLVFDWAADGPDTGDDLSVLMSADGGTTWTATAIAAGGSNLRENFTEARVAVPAAAVSAGEVTVAFAFAAGGGANPGSYWVDHVRLYGDVALPTVSFGGAAQVTRVTEGAGAVTVTIPVTLSASADATVNVEGTGFATQGSDYEFTATNVTFTAGGATTANVTLRVLPDAIAEGSEAFAVSLRNPQGAKPGERTQHVVVIRDDESLQVLTLNAGNGVERDRILELASADVIALQGWTSAATSVAGLDGMGGYTQTSDAGTGLAIASRWMPSATGSLTGSGVPANLWARMELPNGAYLVIVDVDFAGANASARDAEAAALKSAITAAFDANTFDPSDYLLVAGNLGTATREEAAVATLTGAMTLADTTTQQLSDAHVPADRYGLTSTTIEDSGYEGEDQDYLLENEALGLQIQPLDYEVYTYADGAVVDTREWGQHPLPALASDSCATGAAHRGLTKVYTLAQVVANPELTVANTGSATENEWSVTGNGTDPWVVVWNTTGVFGTPVTGVVPGNAGESFLGGTILAKGTGTQNGTHTGLISCQTYYYRAWSYTSADHAYSAGVTRMAETTPPNAPTALTVSGLQANGFTAGWTAATGGGVDHYEICVSAEPFTSALETKASHIGETGTPSAWATTGYAQLDSGAFRMASSKNDGTLTTPTLDLLANNGAATVSFTAYCYGSKTQCPLKIEIQNAGGNWETVTNLTLADSTTKAYTVDVTGSAATKIRFTATKDKQLYLEDVLVQQGGEGAMLPGYDCLAVNGTSCAVTGLEESGSYHWRVRSVGGCEGEWVEYANNPVTTPAAGRITLTPESAAFGEVEKGESETATFTVENTGHAALTVTNITFANAAGGSGSQHFSASTTTLGPIAAGGTATFTVTYAPTAGGAFNVTLQVWSDGANENPATSGLTGSCRDPETEPPSVYDFAVLDGRGTTNTVWDHSLALTAGEPTLSVTMWHYSGMYTNATGDRAAKWRLVGPDGTQIGAEHSFSHVEEVTHNGKTCVRFTAVIPDTGAGEAPLGDYRIEVKGSSQTGYALDWTGYFAPKANAWVFDDFTREDRTDGTVGGGWTVTATNGLTREAVLHDGALELYGPNGMMSGVAGRVGVVQDISGLGYAPAPADLPSVVSWGFHFRTEKDTTSLSSGSTAGAFILGATEGDWYTSEPTQKGYAVLMTNSQVHLVKFTKGLTANANVTTLGTNGYTGTKGKTLAVRVDYVPGEGTVGDAEYVSPKFRLYVKEVEGFGGDPVDECGSGELVTVAEETTHIGESLKYTGMMWNHGTAQVSAETMGVFDDVYLPHVDGQGEPMEFHVVDEDEEAPEFHDFNTVGALKLSDIQADGLVVTGHVHDASGIYTENLAWTLWSNEVEVATGTLTAEPSASGATNDATLRCTIPSSAFGSGSYAGYILSVSASDYDIDREGDSLMGYAEYTFAVSAQDPERPTWCTVEADGEEMVVVRWSEASAEARTKGAKYLVVRSDEPIAEDATPVQGSVYAVGSAVPGMGTVVYFDSGENHLAGSGWQGREFIVGTNSANYFAVLGAAGSVETGYYYSGAVRPMDANGTTAGTTSTNSWPCVTEAYEPGEGVDSFEYRTSVCAPGDLDKAGKAMAFDYETRAETGSGWAEGSAWSGDTGKWKVHDDSLLTGETDYPAAVGNKLYWEDTSTSSADQAVLTRKLDSAVSGDFFVAGIINFLYDGPNKWVNIALMGGEDADTELVSFGKQGSSDGNVAGKAAIWVPSTYDGQSHILTQRYNESNEPYALNGGHGQDYVIIGQVSPTGKVIRLWAYYGGAGGSAIPQDFTNAIPVAAASWQANGLASMPPVTGIRIQAGSDASGQLGHVYFDEIRFGETWDETLLFNKPEVYTYEFGRQNGTDADGRPLWEVSDGQLAHGDIPLPVSLGLFHRTGVQSVEFTFLTNQTPVLRYAVDVAGMSDALTNVVATNANPGHAYSTWSASVTNRAVPTNQVSLDTEYTVQVHLMSTGGKENTTTSASEGGGTSATDLFFGEYGEGARNDKYVELYNGTGHAIDLSEYFVLRVRNDQPHADGYYGDEIYNCAQISSESYILPHHETAVLLNYMKGNDTANSRLAIMKGLLEANGCKVLQMTNDVLDASGKAPLLLMKAEDFAGVSLSHLDKPWLDACGDSKAIVQERFIMSRKADTQLLPRSAPLTVDTSEWDYRGWDEAKDDCDYPAYTNFLATAGVYDREIGLGGDMKFTLYDDDVDAPVVGADSGLEVNGVRRTATTGVKDYVMAGWSFTNQVASAPAEYADRPMEWVMQPWPKGKTQNARITSSEKLQPTTNLVQAGEAGVSQETFNDEVQVKRGALYVKCSDFGIEADDEVWIGFELDMMNMADRVLSFWHAGGAQGFTAGHVEWSATGGDAAEEWTQPTGWDFDPNTGSGTTWAEFTGDLDAAEIPSDIGHLYFRVKLSGRVAASGAYYMDNIQVCGTPLEVVVYDNELRDYAVTFRANVYDTNSGLDTATAEFDLGVTGASLTRDASGVVDGGRGTDSVITWTTGGSLTKSEVTAWYEASQEGLSLKLSVFDHDDDRVDDETQYTGDFGTLRVDDDDTKAPVVNLTTMKPAKGGIVAQWRFTEKGSAAPTRSEASVEVSPLQLKTLEGRVTYPRWTEYAQNDWGVYQTGWQANSKYWYATYLPMEEDLTVTNVTFDSMMSRVDCPTRCVIQVVTHVGENDCETNDVKTVQLASGGAWTAETIKQWTSKNTGKLTVTLEAGHVAEIRLLAQGAPAKASMTGSWRIHALTVRGVLETDDNALTYLTDHELATGTGSATLSGSVWDEVSGLEYAAAGLENPRFSLSSPAPGSVTLYTNEDLIFTSPLTRGGAKTELEGAFSNPLTVALGYKNLKLGEYLGSITATDADDDRDDDALTMVGDLAFYVVDQDVKEPTGTGAVKVNGLASGAMTRENAPWTNNPNFTVTFASEAEDPIPTQGWLEDRGYRSIQNGATGIGEYRVALADTAEARAAAVAVSAAVTNGGALGNGGFERLVDDSWTCAATGCGINKTTGKPVWEGTNAFHLQSVTTYSDAVLRQTVAWENTNATPVTVSGSLKVYKSALGAMVHVDIVTSETEDFATIASSNQWQLTKSTATDPQQEWLEKEIPVTALLGSGSASYLRIEIWSKGGTAAIDDVKLSVATGNDAGFLYRVPLEGQGLANKYLYAVDADNDRAGDRLETAIGEAQAFCTAYDATPPTTVTIPNRGTSVTTDTVEDPTSQFDITWTAAQGPDDPSHPNHPTKAAGAYDILSPWRSYKFYYGTWDPTLEAAASDPIGYINGLIDEGVYTNWDYAMDGKAITDPSEIAKGHTNYNATADKLGQIGTTTCRIYDLENDQDYIVVVVGVDKAGNESLAGHQSWATNNTIKFALTRGWRMSTDDAPAAWVSGVTNRAVSALEWIAAGVKYDEHGVNTNRITKEYDLLYWDAASFNERTNNAWAKSGTVLSNWFVDNPEGLGRDTLRFYRASYKDRWQREVSGRTQVPLVSEDVYSMATVTLTEGINYVSLQGTPYTNTFAAVFGTDTALWPSGSAAQNSTQVRFYNPSTRTFTEGYFIDDVGRWHAQSGLADVTDTLQTNGFFARPFVVVLPEPLPEAFCETVVSNSLYTNRVLNAMKWHPIMHVPTNALSGSPDFETTVHCDTTGALVYNAVSLNLPVVASPSELGLWECGFRPGKKDGDRLYILDAETKGYRGDSTMYCKDNGEWFWTKNDAPVGKVIHPNDMLVIITKGGEESTWVWRYRPSHFYTLPTRHMGE